MPTYDYRCETCGKTFEVFQSFSEDPLTECPDKSCTGTVKKIFSAPGISFKGSGFYKNDSRKSSTTKSTSNSSTTSSNESKSSDSPSTKKEKKDSSTAPSPSSTSGQAD